MAASLPEFRTPSASERAFNRVFGFLVGMGLGASSNYLLQVRGRKSGKIFSTPISLVEKDGRKFLVAPRGRTQWVRNAEAAGEITLKKGSKRQRFQLRPLSGGEKLEILKAYLDSFRVAVQRFFPVPAGSLPSTFAEIEQNYPAFELLPV